MFLQMDAFTKSVKFAFKVRFPHVVATQIFKKPILRVLYLAFYESIVHGVGLGLVSTTFQMFRPLAKTKIQTFILGGLSSLWFWDQRIHLDVLLHVWGRLWYFWFPYFSLRMIVWGSVMVSYVHYQIAINGLKYIYE